MKKAKNVLHTARKIGSNSWGVIISQRSIIEMKFVFIIIRKMGDLLVRQSEISCKSICKQSTRGRRIAALFLVSEENRCKGWIWNWCILNFEVEPQHLRSKYPWPNTTEQNEWRLWDPCQQMDTVTCGRTSLTAPLQRDSRLIEN